MEPWDSSYESIHLIEIPSLLNAPLYVLTWLNSRDLVVMFKFFSE